MTRCLAAECTQHGIRVNSLSSGYMDTRLDRGEDLADVRDIWYRRTPMGKMGDKEELIGQVLLLVSGVGRLMTGADLRVDGDFFGVCSDFLFLSSSSLGYGVKF